MKINLYVDTESFNQKPNVDEIKKISTRILNNKCSITVEELADNVGNLGKTVVLADYINGVKLTSKSVIYGQQVLMLDFDSKKEYFSIEDLENDVFIQENACFYYETFNSTEEKNRFRVVFILDTPILKYKDVEKAYSDLFKKYPMSDTSVGQTNRLFFGSNKGAIEIDYDNRLIINNLQSDNNQIILDESVPNYELFKYHQFDTIAKKLGDTFKGTFPDESVASSFFRTIDIREFLELPMENPFIDILHEESEPSASVYMKEDNGVYLYKCFSSDNKVTMDLIKLVTELTGLGMFKVLEILTQVTNSEIDVNSDIAVTKRKTNVFIDFINRVEFKETEPVLYSWIGRYIPEITTLLQVVSTYVWQDFNSGEIRVISFLNTNNIAKEVSGRLGYTVSPTKMKNVINVLAVIDGIYKLEDSDIPTNLLESLNGSKINKEHYRRANVLELKEYSDDYIIDAREIAKELKNNNVTVKGLSFELLYRIFDEDKAKQVFPQTINANSKTKISKENSSIETKVVKFIMQSIENSGYVFEQDIISFLNKRMSKSNATYKLQQMRTDICNKYGLTRERLSKDIQKTYSIQGKITPKIVYHFK